MWYDIMAILATAGLLILMVILLAIAGAIAGRNAHIARKAAR